MKTILVVANETIGGAKLHDTVRAKASGGEVRVIICVPRTKPDFGNVIYDEAVYDAARVRVDLARIVLRQEGIDAVGEVGDPDPYSATMDCVREYEPDEIIISTKPAEASGWMRRDLIERVQEASGLPVEHVVTDIDNEGLPFGVTLVVANRTASGDDLLNAMRESAGTNERHVFIICIPQDGGDATAASRARGRLVQLIDRARAAGLFAAGIIGDPDPYTATMNALAFFRVDDIIISTLPATRSGWLRADLVQRVQNAARKPVKHIESQATTSAAA